MTVEKKPGSPRIKWKALAAACMALLIILLLPPQEGLPESGQRALAVLAFSIVIWVTEAVTYPVSAAFIIVLLTVLLGFSPQPDEGGMIGTKTALEWALSGFSSGAVALVAGALFLSAAMQETGLDRRLALTVLTKVGTTVKGILFGVILVGILLSLFIPSPTARVGAMIPIVMGMISAFGLSKNSRISTLLMLAVAHTATIWSIGIKTATPQNMVGLNFIEKAFPYPITWLQWFLVAAPLSLVMSIALYFVLLLLIRPEIKEIPTKKDAIKKQLRDLGSMSASQIRLLIISFAALAMWATEKSVHSFDSTTIVLLLVSIILAPGIGVLTWEVAEKKIPWGTIILFAAGISLGTVLLNTKGASWLAKIIFQSFGLSHLPLLILLSILAGFTILIHIGFASATSLASTLIPVVIAFVKGMELTNAMQGMGIVLITQFAIGFGFILPVNAPQNMLAYGTGSVKTGDFIKTGVILTLVGYGVILLFSLTYWKWIGLLP
ncbi:DASS family sodium-coupled anion symporter [Neobacillus sp. PS3-34]|nr:DASS family sodium-coupled anion symporter [Neobacillus sp. PS3-34]WML50708.1 DASS family sodium-coupled anion symporter [Neobacillus sp. PS3-34]